LLSLSCVFEQHLAGSVPVWYNARQPNAKARIQVGISLLAKRTAWNLLKIKKLSQKKSQPTLLPLLPLCYLRLWQHLHHLAKRGA
jgi:hypothetical protein